MSVGVRGQPGRLGHHRAVGVDRAQPGRGRPGHHLGQQVQAVGPGPGRVGVGEVAAEVAQAGRPEQGVGQGVGHGVGVAVAGQARAPSGMHHAPQHQGPGGSSVKGWTSKPCPMRTVTATPGSEVLGVGQVLGGGQLQVARDRPAPPAR